MSTTEILNAILDPLQFNAVFDSGALPLRIEIEAAPTWFAKGDLQAEPREEGEPGETQAVITIAGKRYCISPEELP